MPKYLAKIHFNGNEIYKGNIKNILAILKNFTQKEINFGEH